MEHHWRYDKMITVGQVKTIAAKLTAAGKKLVTANGSFDIIHAGHLDLLEEAKQQGDVLFVGINSDKSVQDGKGAQRPFIPQQERAAMLAALTCVDYVCIIDASYAKVPEVLLEAVRPTVHVNGSEYGQPEDWIEWPAMHTLGVAGHVVPRRPALSTSDIIKKIKASA